MAENSVSIEIFADRISFERLMFQSRALARLIDDAISKGRREHLDALTHQDSSLEGGDIAALSWLLKENVDDLYTAVFGTGEEEPAHG